MAAADMDCCNLDNNANNMIDMEHFLKNAHFFLEHADEILADERMFLIPIPVDNVLGYVHCSGLKKATLGTYIEWWQTEEKAQIHLPDDSVELIYQLTGSLLSGSNCCKCVNINGMTREINACEFTGLCKSLVAVNRKYQTVVDVALLTLEEVRRVLSANERTAFNLNG